MESARGRTAGRWAAVTAAAVAAVFVAGATLDRGPFAEEELSRAALIARADQVCYVAHAAYVELQSDPPRSLEEAADLTASLLEIAEDEQARIEELDAPPELEAQLEDYLAARADGIEIMERGLAAARGGDEAAYVGAQRELERTQEERFRAAREIGFAQCSRPISGPGSGNQLPESAGALSDP